MRMVIVVVVIIVVIVQIIIVIKIFNSNFKVMQLKGLRTFTIIRGGSATEGVIE